MIFEAIYQSSFVPAGETLFPVSVFIPPVGDHSDFQKVQTVFVNTRHQIVCSYETAYQQSARNVNNLMFHIGIGAAASLGTKQINDTRPAGRFMLKPLGGGQRIRRSSATECAMC